MGGGGPGAPFLMISMEGEGQRGFIKKAIFHTRRGGERHGESKTGKCSRSTARFQGRSSRLEEGVCARVVTLGRLYTARGGGADGRKWRSSSGEGKPRTILKKNVSGAGIRGGQLSSTAENEVGEKSKP